MLNDLLTLKRITPEQHQLYMLYEGTELGRNALNRMMRDTYMDEPKPTEWNGVGFAFYDGRRSVFRDIQRAISYVKSQLEEIQNDGSNQRQ